eukprot:TRINITY_DN2860_c0_g3_i1.p1 TRINITY_DN2860_c0_g3~~TRINITY_DN2860_c0_g3_i1.p1  ORF type:complete len:1867 (+),score=245.41 TRINITY_DN2860_c0_g3_i1:184-5784(+)
MGCRVGVEIRETKTVTVTHRSHRGSDTCESPVMGAPLDSSDLVGVAPGGGEKCAAAGAQDAAGGVQTSETEMQASASTSAAPGTDETLRISSVASTQIMSGPPGGEQSDLTGLSIAQAVRITSHPSSEMRSSKVDVSAPSLSPSSESGRQVSSGIPGLERGTSFGSDPFFRPAPPGPHPLAGAKSPFGEVPSPCSFAKGSRPDDASGGAPSSPLVDSNAMAGSLVRSRRRSMQSRSPGPPPFIMRSLSEPAGIAAAGAGGTAVKAQRRSSDNSLWQPKAIPPALSDMDPCNSSVSVSTATATERRTPPAVYPASVQDEADACDSVVSPETQVTNSPAILPSSTGQRLKSSGVRGSRSSSVGLFAPQPPPAPSPGSAFVAPQPPPGPSPGGRPRRNSHGPLSAALASPNYSSVVFSTLSPESLPAELPMSRMLSTDLTFALPASDAPIVTMHNTDLVLPQQPSQTLSQGDSLQVSRSGTFFPSGTVTTPSAPLSSMAAGPLAAMAAAGTDRLVPPSVSRRDRRSTSSKCSDAGSRSGSPHRISPFHGGAPGPLSSQHTTRSGRERCTSVVSSVSTIQERITFQGNGLTVRQDQHNELTRVNDYTVLRELGKGVSGVVYQVCDQDENMFAMKAVPRRLSKHAKAEAQALKILQHQCIIRFFHTIDCEEYRDIFTILEYIDGQHLCQITPDGMLVGERWSEEAARTVIRPLVNACVYMHLKGVIHRDIKPDNIMYEKDTDRPVFIDFGSCFRLGKSKGDDDSTRATVGAPYFRPPEAHALTGDQFAGKALDVWALGVLLHLLLLGRVPFAAGHSGTEMQLAHRLAEEEERLDLRDAEKLGLSLDARRLLQRVLDLDMTRRISLIEFRDHRWLTQAAFCVPTELHTQSSALGSSTQASEREQSCGGSSSPGLLFVRAATAGQEMSREMTNASSAGADMQPWADGSPRLGGAYGSPKDRSGIGRNLPPGLSACVVGRCDTGPMPSTPHLTAFTGFGRPIPQRATQSMDVPRVEPIAPAARHSLVSNTSSQSLRPPVTPLHLGRQSGASAHALVGIPPLAAASPGAQCGSPTTVHRFTRHRLPDDVPPSPGVRRMSSVAPTPKRTPTRGEGDQFANVRDDQSSSSSSTTDSTVGSRCATFTHRSDTVPDLRRTPRAGQRPWRCGSPSQSAAGSCRERQTQHSSAGGTCAAESAAEPSAHTQPAQTAAQWTPQERNSPLKEPRRASEPVGTPADTPAEMPALAIGESAAQAHRRQQQAATSPQDSSANLSFKVMLVTSCPHGRRVLLKMLTELIAPKDETCHIDVAIDGQDAVDAVKEAHPDEPYALILMDLNMARVSGLLAAALIRQQEQAQKARIRIPIVGMTGGEEDEDLPAMLHQSGMNNAIAKPVDWRILRKVLKWAGIPVKKAHRISVDKIFCGKHSYEKTYRRTTEQVQEVQLCFPLEPMAASPPHEEPRRKGELLRRLSFTAAKAGQGGNDSPSSQFASPTAFSPVPGVISPDLEHVPIIMSTMRELSTSGSMRQRTSATITGLTVPTDGGASDASPGHRSAPSLGALPQRAVDREAPAADGAAKRQSPCEMSTTTSPLASPAADADGNMLTSPGGGRRRRRAQTLAALPAGGSTPHQKESSVEGSGRVSPPPDLRGIDGSINNSPRHMLRRGSASVYSQEPPLLTPEHRPNREQWADVSNRISRFGQRTPVHVPGTPASGGPSASQPSGSVTARTLTNGSGPATGTTASHGNTCSSPAADAHRSAAVLTTAEGASSAARLSVCVSGLGCTPLPSALNTCISTGMTSGTADEQRPLGLSHQTCPMTGGRTLTGVLDGQVLAQAQAAAAQPAALQRSPAVERSAAGDGPLLRAATANATTGLPQGT